MGISSEEQEQDQNPMTRLGGGHMNGTTAHFLHDAVYIFAVDKMEMRKRTGKDNDNSFIL